MPLHCCVPQHQAQGLAPQVLPGTEFDGQEITDFSESGLIHLELKHRSWEALI